MPGSYVHMQVEIPPKMSVTSCAGFQKGKSRLMVYEQRSNIKFKYRNREFWSKGYYADTAGKNAHKIAEYIQNQLKEDALSDRLTLDLSDPFTGDKKRNAPARDR